MKMRVIEIEGQVHQQLSQMVDHKGGTESVALSKKRGSDERKDSKGSSDKRRKNEQGAASTSNTSGKAAAPELHPTVAKKPRKAPNLCEHQRVRSRRKDCVDSGICEHQRQRSDCKH